jgi:hypothetical protein
MIASSKAAAIVIGAGNEVAELKFPEDAKSTPGELATP